jgi:hypothetical protein
MNSIDDLNKTSLAYGNRKIKGKYTKKRKLEEKYNYCGNLLQKRKESQFLTAASTNNIELLEKLLKTGKQNN